MSRDEERWDRHNKLKESLHGADVPEKWPTDAEEEATREMVALGDSLGGNYGTGISAMSLLEIYLSVDEILRRHNQNPRKLRDAMNYLSKWSNE